MKKQTVYSNPSAKEVLAACKRKETFVCKYVEMIGEKEASVTIVTYVRGKQQGEPEHKIVTDPGSLSTRRIAEFALENTEAIGKGVNALLRAEVAKEAKAAEIQARNASKQKAHKLSINVNFFNPIEGETEDQVSVNVSGNASELFAQIQGFAKRGNEVSADKLTKTTEAIAGSLSKNFGGLVKLFS